MKRALQRGLLAATAMMMTAAPTDGSPIIVFTDTDRDRCVSPSILWLDPWLPLIFDPAPLDACEESPATPPAVAVSRGAIRAGSMGGGMAGLQTWAPLAALLSAGAAPSAGGEPIASAVPPPPTLPPPPRPPSLPPPMAGGDGPPSDDTLPTRESTLVDVTGLPDGNHIGWLGPAAFPAASPPVLVPSHSDVPALIDIQDLDAANPAVVPEPGSLLLFGSGLALAARQLRKRGRDGGRHNGEQARTVYPPDVTRS